MNCANARVNCGTVVAGAGGGPGGGEFPGGVVPLAGGCEGGLLLLPPPLAHATRQSIKNIHATCLFILVVLDYPRINLSTPSSADPVFYRYCDFTTFPTRSP